VVVLEKAAMFPKVDPGNPLSGSLSGYNAFLQPVSPLLPPSLIAKQNFEGINNDRNAILSRAQEVNLKENLGSHTLRKTFGYIHRTVFNTDIPTLMQMRLGDHYPYRNGLTPEG